MVCPAVVGAVMAGTAAANAVGGVVSRATVNAPMAPPDAVLPSVSDTWPGPSVTVYVPLPADCQLPPGGANEYVAVTVVPLVVEATNVGVTAKPLGPATVMSPGPTPVVPAGSTKLTETVLAAADGAVTVVAEA